MKTSRPQPSLQLSHTTISVRDIDVMLAFYCDVLGFHITNRGVVGPDEDEMAFISQDPGEHHQIVFVSGPTTEHQFVMADHLAFRTKSLDDLRTIGTNLENAGVRGVIPISHGNAWSLYFNDPEGNGLECFLDTPFHVAQPYADGLDLAATDNEITAATRTRIEGLPEFQPIEQWQASFAKTLSSPRSNRTEA